MTLERGGGRVMGGLGGARLTSNSGEATEELMGGGRKGRRASELIQGEDMAMTRSISFNARLNPQLHA